MQNVFDWLHEKSKNNQLAGIDLMNIVLSEENILLAYRTIKANTGSKTSGTDGITIEKYKIKNKDKFIKEIKNALNDYKPNSVKRVEIPKPNGKKRPLGIPTMRDRLIQQMFKQVLEPICEAKFYSHSYGFRPNRGTHHAMARCQHLVNCTNNHYVVDVDIQSFFDNVNHNKLLKQMYTIGIKDKRVLQVIAKMLKAPIKGVGVPRKGTPQGGIISPLLSNIVLNDLDWWISSQWENMKTEYQYSNKGKKIRAIKKSNLKEMYIVRYADDFKVFTNSHKNAEKIFYAVKEYLSNHLHLDISKEKSTIRNLRRKSSDFLGFKLKAVKKRKRYVANTHVQDKKIESIINKLKEAVIIIQKNPTAQNVNLYNSIVLGMHNYYKGATHVNINFATIAYRISKTLYNRLKSIGKWGIPINSSATYKRFYRNQFKTFKVAGIHLFPIADVQTKNLMNFSQDICNYTVEGRKKIYERLKPDISHEIQKMIKLQMSSDNLEFSDNRISKYSMQKGKCIILGRELRSEETHCHHIIPRHRGGIDKFGNLIIIHKDMHKLIHATNIDLINNILKIYDLSKEQVEKLNKYREKCSLNLI